MRLLSWAKGHNFELENHSVEEWLISPMITNNKELWVIRIMIPFKNIESAVQGRALFNKESSFLL